MSRIFKSTNVNLGQPLAVTIDEKELQIKRKMMTSDRSSSPKGKDPASTASNIIERANSEANEILEKVTEQAEKALFDAKIEADLIKNDAIKQGYQEGFQQGLESGKRETEDLARQALAIKEEVEAERDNLIKIMESQVVDIILESVKKIIGQELTTSKDYVVGMVSTALNKLSIGRQVTIRVSDQDYETLNEKKDEVIAGCKGISDIEVKEDLSLNSGDCIIETEHGDIDASVDKQIENYENVITELTGIDENE